MIAEGLDDRAKEIASCVCIWEDSLPMGNVTLAVPSVMQVGADERRQRCKGVATPIGTMEASW